MGRALALESSRDASVGRARWLDMRGRWLNALLLAWTDRLEASRTTLVELRSQAAESGHEHVLPYLLNWLGRVDCLAGNWHEGLAYAREAYDASVQGGLEIERPNTLATIALALAHLGEVDAARDAISEGLEVSRTTEVMPGRLELLAARGFLELSLGRPGHAHATLLELADEAAAAGFGQPAVLRFHPDLIEAALDVGDLETANRVQGELDECAATLESPWSRATSARCSGLVAGSGGDLDTALERLELALAEHEQLSNAFERGRTLVHLGIVLRRLKRKRAARDSLQAGLAIFTEHGARLWAERARAELARISGSSPSAGNELSETERRIATLVASGQANKQVAAELHVTVRTVESNLTRVYQKLGIRSRSQLAARMHDLP
jgi:DNA-binding CsgD family transcriptional regulator